MQNNQEKSQTSPLLTVNVDTTNYNTSQGRSQNEDQYLQSARKQMPNTPNQKTLPLVNMLSQNMRNEQLQEAEDLTELRRPTITAINHDLDDSKNDIDDSSSSRSKGKSKTLIQQDKRKKTMWAQRVSRVGFGSEGALIQSLLPPTSIKQQQLLQVPETNIAQKKKRVRARVKNKSKNTSILDDDSVDQFLRDEQLVHQAITISSLGEQYGAQNLNGIELESIQEEIKEGQDDDYKIINRQSQISTPNFENLKQQPPSYQSQNQNNQGSSSSTHHHRKTSSLIQNDKQQIIIVNNINVTNTNFTTNQSSQQQQNNPQQTIGSFINSSSSSILMKDGSFGGCEQQNDNNNNNVQNNEKTQRKITIRKRQDETTSSQAQSKRSNNGRPPLADYRGTPSDEFLNVDLANPLQSDSSSGITLINSKSTPSKRVEVRANGAGANMRDSLEGSSNASSSTKKQNTSEFDLEFDDPDIDSNNNSNNPRNEDFNSRNKNKFSGLESGNSDGSGSSGIKSQVSERRKSKRVKVNVNKKMTIKRPNQQQNDAAPIEDDEDKQELQIYQQQNSIQQNQEKYQSQTSTQKHTDSSIVELDKSQSPDKEFIPTSSSATKAKFTTSSSPKKQQQQQQQQITPKDDVMDIMREIEETIQRKKSIKNVTQSEDQEEKRRQQQLLLEREQEQSRLKQVQEQEQEIERQKKLKQQQKQQEEEQMRIKQELQERQRKELEEQIRKELEEQIRKEQEDRLKREQEEKLQREKEERERQEEEYRLLREQREKERIEMEEVFRQEREFQDQKRKQEDKERLTIIKDREELLEMLGMNKQSAQDNNQKDQSDDDEEQKLSQNQLKIIKKQNTFTNQLLKGNTVQFEESCDESMISNNIDKSSRIDKSQSDITLDHISQIQGPYGLRMDNDKRPTFGNDVSRRSLFNDERDIQNILEDSFFRDPLKKNLETSPLKHLEREGLKYLESNQHHSTRNLHQFSPSGTPSFHKFNESNSQIADGRDGDDKIFVMREINTFKDQLASSPEPVQYKMFQDSPLKQGVDIIGGGINDQSPDNFSPSQFNPNQSQFNRSLESGTISLKSSPNQKRMMDQFNQSRDINKTTQSMMLIDSESINFNQQYSNQQSNNNFTNQQFYQPNRINQFQLTQNNFLNSNQSSTSNIFNTQNNQFQNYNNIARAECNEMEINGHPRTERNRKSSKNQFAVSNSNKQTPNNVNKLQGNYDRGMNSGVGGTTQKKSKSPVRKPREYTTKVVLDDDDDESSLVRKGKQKIQDDVKIGLVPVKREEIKQARQNLGRKTPQKGSIDYTNNKAATFATEKKALIQSEQTKSQMLPQNSKNRIVTSDFNDKQKQQMSRPNQFQIMTEGFLTQALKFNDSPQIIMDQDLKIDQSQQAKKPIIQNKEKKVVKVILDDDDNNTEDNESSTLKTFSQLLKTPSDSVCDSFCDDSTKNNPFKGNTLRRNTNTGKSQSNLHSGQAQGRNGPVGQILNNPKQGKRNLFESQINLKDMGDGDISPINPRKSYLIDKNKSKLKQPTKITETDPQLYINRIQENEKQQNEPMKKQNSQKDQQQQDRRTKASKPNGVRDQFKHTTKLW